MGRIEIEIGPARWEDVRARLKTVFGIQYFSNAERAARPRAMAGRFWATSDDKPASFVTARRTDKRFPLTSPQIEFEVAAASRTRLARRPSHPELTVHVDLLPDHAFYFRQGTRRGRTADGHRRLVVLLPGVSTRRSPYR
jgi:adenylyl- and sulfurtransferase ThiI